MDCLIHGLGVERTRKNVNNAKASIYRTHILSPVDCVHHKATIHLVVIVVCVCVCDERAATRWVNRSVHNALQRAHGVGRPPTVIISADCSLTNWINLHFCRRRRSERQLDRCVPCVCVNDRHLFASPRRVHWTGQWRQHARHGVVTHGYRASEKI